MTPAAPNARTVLRMKIAMFVLTLVVAGPLGAGEPSPHPLSGAWRLDPARSEDVRQKMRAQMDAERDREGERGAGRRGPGGGMGGRGGGGMGGRGGGMGGPGGGQRGPGGGPGSDPRAMRAAMDGILAAPGVLAITAGPSEVELLEGDGSIRRLRPDGRKVKREGDAVTEVRARWDGDMLVSETWLGATHVTQRYARDATTNELVVEVRVEGPRGRPITGRRVYLPDGAPDHRS